MAKQSLLHSLTRSWGTFSGLFCVELDNQLLNQFKHLLRVFLFLDSSRKFAPICSGGCFIRWYWYWFCPLQQGCVKLSVSSPRFSGDRRKHAMQTPCRAAIQSSASFHRKSYPWAPEKIQTARSIPSKQTRENGLLRAIQACVAYPCQTWFLTECPFPARA